MYRKYFKRPMDIILSLLAMIVLLPVYIIIAILVRIKLGSPIIFKQKRPGLNEKIFTLYKFRTMTDKKDEQGNLLPDEQRLTKFGKFLRSTSLDELPELWNILKGEMSIIGPRPLAIEYLPYYSNEEKRRHTVRPGLSGLAQISGRNTINWEQKFAKDIEYANNITFISDWKIIFKTIMKIFNSSSVISASTININGHILRPLNIERKKKVKNFDEIGSNFAFKDDISFQQKTKDIFQKNNIIFLDSGRSAIRLVLDTINIDRKIAILPAFTCTTVIEPFIENDYKVYYYDIEEDLSINVQQFQKLVEKVRPSVILLHAYFGFDTISNIRKYINQLRKNNIYIIEDITQILLNENLDTKMANFIVGSIRKWVAIPDGAVLINNTKLTINLEEKENEEFVELQTKAAKLKIEYTYNLDFKIKEEYNALFCKAREKLDNNRKIFSLSNLSKSLLSSYDFKNIREKRQENFIYLRNEMLKFKTIKCPLNEKVKNEIPLYFPMIIDFDREEFQKYMASKNIYLPIIWPKDENYLDIENYKCNKLYKKMICIPCDQRYNIEDMKRIVNSINIYIKEKENVQNTRYLLHT